MDSPPRLFHRRVLELWDYEWNPILQMYERVSFRALHVTEPPENPPDVFQDVRDFYGAIPISVQRRIDFSSPPPPTQARVPPPRPPTPNFDQRREESPAASPPASPAAMESPESPDPSEPYSPTDTPTRRIRPASPPWSPDRLHCDQSLYVARQDHVFALPLGCPDHPATPPPPFSATNPPLQPPPEPRRRRTPPPPRPRGRGRGILRPAAVGASPYERPGSQQPPAVRPPPPPFQRVRNLFSDFVPNILPASPPTVRTFPSPQRQPLPPSRTPSPDIMQEVYSHGRHPVDERSHLTIMPSWALKAEKEVLGECIICHGTVSHLQIRCRNCAAQKVCCVCVVGIYQSINSCPTCRFRGEF